MLQRTLVPSVMAAVVVIAAGCGLMKKSEKPPPEPVTVSATQSGTTVELVAGQALVVRLPSNHTTGYRWIYVEPKDAVLRVDGPSTYETAQSAGNTAGAGGTEIWKLAPLKAGQQQLRFEYRRPWEQDVKPSQVVTYAVTVK
ncbi:MAG: protease inhibitor I42 family protein [Candidatus Rokuibacteriota bacterium]